MSDWINDNSDVWLSKQKPAGQEAHFMCVHLEWDSRAFDGNHVSLWMPENPKRCCEGRSGSSKCPPVGRFQCEVAAAGAQVDHSKRPPEKDITRHGHDRASL